VEKGAIRKVQLVNIADWSDDYFTASLKADLVISSCMLQLNQNIFL